MKYGAIVSIEQLGLSPSTRREWIEINLRHERRIAERSPSTRREWIEIKSKKDDQPEAQSPSTRREWIEIVFMRRPW